MSKLTKKILVTGSTGLVGSRFVELSKDKFSIITCGRENVDIYLNLLSEKEIKRVVESLDVQAVINFAAYTNVDEAQKQKGNTSEEAYLLNAMVPLWLARSCQASGKKLYHISTDYVFDGKREDRPYTEKDIPKPVDSWYSKTKYKGEISVTQGFKKKENFAIIRISYPYSGIYKRKLDIARTVIERLSIKQPYLGIIDQRVKPTSVDDIAGAISLIINKMASGIFHVAGNFSPNEYTTPYEFATKIAETFKLNSSLVKSISFAKLSKERIAPRPQHTWLDTKKIEQLGFTITNIDKALNRFKQQLTNS